VNNLPLHESVALYRDELKKSLKFHLRSDVTVGNCLSGGLDSSVIAAIVSVNITRDQTAGSRQSRPNQSIPNR
jgi:asparagine synthase (glutamine-hydrolysing)